MSTSDRRTDRCPIEPRPQHQGRYAALKTTNDQIVLYDTKIETAWIKTTCAIAIESME